MIITGPGSPVMSSATIADILQRWRNGEVVALPPECRVEVLDSTDPVLSQWTPNLIDCIALACVEYPIREATP